MILAAIGVLAPASHAQTWDGEAGTNAWGTANNWSPNGVPSNSSTVTFDGDTANGQFSIDLGGNRTVAGVVFGSGAGGAFTIFDNTLTVNASGITNNDNTTHLINSGVTVSSNQTWNAASGGLNFGGLVTLSNNLTISGAHAVNLTGTLLNNGNRTLTNNNTGGLTIADIDLAQNGTSRTLTIAGSGTTMVAGVIADTATSGAVSNLTKSGTGTLILSGANTFTGTTTINQGAVRISAESGLGANPASFAANRLTLNGGTLQTTATFAIDDANRGITVSSSGGTFDVSGDTTLTISNVIAGSGGLTKTGSGTLALTAANSYAGVTTINQGTLTASILANGGTNSSIGSVTGVAANLVINGGTLSYVGGATSTNRSFTLGINGGTLDASGTGAVNFTNASGIVLSGTNTARTLTLSGTNTDSNTLAGAIGNNGSGATSVVKTSAGKWVLFGNSTYTGSTTVHSGTINAQHNNALGNGNVTVANGATLQLQGSGLSLGNGGSTINLSGTGSAGNGGALVNVGGGSTRLNNHLALAGDATISSGTTSGATLILGGAPPAYIIGTSAPDSNTINLGSNKLTFAGAANTTIQVDSNITGTGGVDINMGGSVGSLGVVNYNANKNTYTGTTTVLNGKLIVNTANNPFAPHDPNYTSFHGINGPLVIGNGTGDAQTAVVQLGELLNPASPIQHNSLLSTAPITIFGDGYLNLNNSSVNIGRLTMNGGQIDTGTGVLYLDFANTAVDINTSGTSGTSIINGKLNLTFHKDAVTEGALPNQVRTFNVGHTAGATSDLTVNALVQEGSLVKTGAGTMTLATSNNQYLGSTTINAGILNVQVGTDGTSNRRSSLGAGDSTGTAGAGTIVNSGGTLQLEGGIAITHEHLVIKGDGSIGTAGALENKSGNNTWGAGGSTGGIQLGANARIGSAAGTLTINSTISSTAGNSYGLTVDGPGDTTINGSINTGSGANSTLTKTGTGTLTLTGNNGYQGATTISQGVVSVQNNHGLGATTAGTTVNAGAELQLSNAANGNLTIGAETIILNGGGRETSSGANNGTTGALRNIAGNNSLAGDITLASAARINSDSGTLTVNGGLGTSHHALTVGGAGNTIFTGPSGIVVGSGSLTKDGTGTLGFANGSRTFGQAFLNAGKIDVMSGALNTKELSSLAGTTLHIASGGMVTANYTSDATIAGEMTGLGTFVKNGAGTLTISSNIDFDGSLVVNGGHVTVSGDSASIGSITLNSGILEFSGDLPSIEGLLTISGGTLRLSSSHLTVDRIHITGNTVVDFGSSSISILEATNLLNSLTIAPGVSVSVINWANAADHFFAQSWPGQTINTTGQGQELQITFDGYPNTQTSWLDYTSPGFNEIIPAPEPSTYGAIFMGVTLAFVGYRRLRRSSKKV